MVKLSLVNVTMHAAVFCINLMLFCNCLGSPYNKELELSSLELMNACTCTKISAVPLPK